MIRRAFFLSLFTSLSLVPETGLRICQASPIGTFVDLHLDTRFTRSAELMENFAQLGSDTTAYNDTTDDPSLNYQFDLVLAAGFPTLEIFGFPLYLGGFVRYWLPRTLTHEGTRASTNQSTTKSTEITGYSVGPLARLYLQTTPELGVFVEAGVSTGPTTVSQTFTQGSAQSTLKASAWVIETRLQVGGHYNFSPNFGILFGLAYAREQSNVYSVDTVTGTEYSVSADDRLYVNDDDGASQEFQFDRSGFILNLGFLFAF